MNRTRTAAGSPRGWLTIGALTLFGLCWALLFSPVASAGLTVETTVSPDSTATSAPLVLASTGLDITGPVLLGLGVLVLGTVLVGWVFLATGRRSSR